MIAEHKRRSPSAGVIREGATVAEIVQAYERGGAAALSVLTEGQHFGGSLDDLRAARGRHRAAGPAQGLHRRPLPALRVGGGRRRRDPADRRRARATTTSASSTARRAASTSTCWSRSTTSEELERALDVDAEVLGINNRDLDRLHRRHRAHLRAAGRRPGRQDGRLGVGLLDPRAARRARARRRRRGAGRRDADARRRPRGRLPRAGGRARARLRLARPRGLAAR